MDFIRGRPIWPETWESRRRADIEDAEGQDWPPIASVPPPSGPDVQASQLKGADFDAWMQSRNADIQAEKGMDRVLGAGLSRLARLDAGKNLQAWQRSRRPKPAMAPEPSREQWATGVHGAIAASKGVLQETGLIPPEKMRAIAAKSPLVARQLGQMTMGGAEGQPRAPAPEGTPRDAEMDAALAQARQNKMWEGLVNAGRDVGAAISRHPGTAEQLDLDTRAPVNELQARRQRAAQVLASARQAQLDEIGMKEHDWRGRGEQRAETEQEFRHGMGEKEFALKEKNAAALRVLQEAQARKAGRAGMAASPDPKMLARAGEKAAAQGRVLNHLRILEGAIQGGGDIPGAGILDSRLTGNLESLQSAEGVPVRKAAQGAISDMVFSLSGKAASNQERAQIAQTYGLQEGGTERGFRAGVGMLREDVDLMMRGLRASHAPEVWAQYAAEGGAMPGAPATKRQAPQQPGTPTWDPTAKRWRW